MTSACPDCGRPVATTQHEQATDGYCWNDTGCYRAQIAVLREAVRAADAMRSWYDKNMGPDGPELGFDTAREKVKL